MTRNGTTNQWILNPNPTLASRTTYTVTLTGGAAAIRDAAGNPLTHRQLDLHHRPVLTGREHARGRDTP